MAESMVSVVIAVALIAFAAILVVHHQFRRDSYRGRAPGHFERRHLWERVRHRH
ncbi:hypothetical protein BX592_1128 [Paraburkholderia rhizosphaerae]|uniref:Uncharacterized protein n=1 Tax=Paraburkholderia rhizosphaerae TaxID=480658 RepID=A0A4R8LQ42_9BURK|nr:hypothetical protein BX592_1128 [Paraburkholderia rhizosphaerae]